MSVDLVVSVYKEDMAWLRKLSPQPPRIFAYDKGTTNDVPVPFTICEARPNVGKCDETFLYHIVKYYDDLADWTVLTPDYPFDHLEGVRFEKMLEPKDELIVPWASNVRDWGPDGRIMWEAFVNRPDRNGTNWMERYSSGKIKRARLSFVDFARNVARVNLGKWLGYQPGGVIGAPRRMFLARPKEYWETLLSHVQGSVEPEEGHYMERLWLLILDENGKPDNKAEKAIR